MLTPDELRALADAATPGPWLVGFSDGSGERCITTPESREDFSVPNVVNGGCDSWGVAEGVLRPDDARLIALAPSLARDHAALLDWAERAADVLREPWETVWAVDEAEPELGKLPTVRRKDTDALLAEWAEMQERPS